MATAAQPPTASSADQTTLQNLTTQYQTLQSELQTHISTRQTLSSQLSESSSVASELAAVPSDSKQNIYKMVGPCLLKQDREEAVQAVQGRLDFIKNEVKRVDGLIEKAEGGGEELKMKIFELQTRVQQSQGQGQGEGSGK